MSFEEFAQAHPIAYVHMAYAVVWVLHFGYAGWVWRSLRRERDNDTA
jgi:hypothetical protein